jgi:RHS repeat-associated protein
LPNTPLDAYQTYNPHFIAVDGSRSILTVKNDPNGSLPWTLYRNGDDFYAATLYGQVGYNPARERSGNFVFGGVYYLETADGTRYTIDAKTGKAVSSEDANHNVTTYGNDTSSNGTQLKFEREGNRIRFAYIADGAGNRIGNKIEYQYDGNGDLRTVIDRNAKATQYTYAENAPPHFLTKVTDALNVDTVRATYDERDGRLKSLKNVAGHEAPINSGEFVGGSKPQTVTDLTGNETELIYNDRGDVIREIKADKRNGVVAGYIVTVHKYDYVEQDTWDVRFEGKTLVGTLSTVTEYRPFRINGADASGERYTRQVGDPDRTHSVIYDITENSSGSPNLRLPVSETFYSDSGPRTVSYANYVFGRPKQVDETVNGITRTTKSDYDSNGNVLWTLNPNGEGAKFEYTTGAAGTNLPKGLVLKTWRAWDHDGNPNTAPVPLRPGTDPKPDTESTYYENSAASSIGSRGRQRSTLKWLEDPSQAGQYYQADLTFFAYNKDGSLGMTAKFWDNPDTQQSDRWVVTQNLYDAEGRVTETSEAVFTDAGTAGVFDWSLSGALATCTEASGVLFRTISQTSYDALGRAKTTTDQFGGVTVNSYDARGNLVRTFYPDGTETRSVFDDMGRVVWNIQRFASTSVYNPTTGAFTSNDNTTTSIVTHNKYDALGHVIQTRRYKNARIPLQTSSSGNGLFETETPPTVDLTTTTPISSSITLFNKDGRIVETTNVQGLRTGFMYFNDGRTERSGELEVSAPVGGPFTADDFVSATSYTYDAAEGDFIVDTVTDARGMLTKSYKDSLGRVVKATQQNNTTGLVIGPFTTRTFYGTDNQAVDPNVSQVSNPSTADGFPSAFDGQHVIKLDEQNQATHYLYDSAGRLTEVWQPLVADADNGGASKRPHWHYEYDKNGQLVRQVDPKQHATVFVYDDRGRRTKRTLPDGATHEDWSYDASGRLVLHADFKGQATQYRYSDEAALGLSAAEQKLGRLVQELRFTSALDGTPDERTSYDYDNLGRREQVVELVYVPNSTTVTSSRTSSFLYDTVTGALTLIASPEGIVRHAYDETSGRLKATWTAPSLETATDLDTARNSARTLTEYDYDTHGRLKHVYAKRINSQAPTADQTTEYDYDLVGNLTNVWQSTGAQMSYTLDGVNRLTNLLVQHGTRKIFKQHFDLEEDGQRHSVLETRYDPNGNTPPGTLYDTRIDWTYDALNRLTKEVRDVGNNATSNPGDYTHTYAFDLAGNRKTKTIDNGNNGIDETITSTYNSKDQLAQEDSDLTSSGPGVDHVTTYGYDANGSTTSRALDAVPVATYRWDLRNHLVGYDKNGDGNTTSNGDITYTFDQDGNRVNKQVVGGDFTAFLIDGQNPTGYAQVLEETVSPISTKSHTYVIGSDVIAQADASAVVQHFMYDGHGSTRALLNALAQPVTDQVFDFDAYGNRLDTSNQANTSTAILYSGEWWDADLGQQYLRARYFDPAIGRFSSFDTFEGDPSSPASLHKYLYAGSDPTNRIDPTGHFTVVDVLSTAFNWSKTAANGLVRIYQAKKLRDRINLAFVAATVVGGILAPNFIDNTLVYSFPFGDVVKSYHLPNIEFAIARSAAAEFPRFQVRISSREYGAFQGVLRLNIPIPPGSAGTQQPYAAAGFNIRLYKGAGWELGLTFRFNKDIGPAPSDKPEAFFDRGVTVGLQLKGSLVGAVFPGTFSETGGLGALSARLAFPLLKVSWPDGANALWDWFPSVDPDSGEVPTIDPPLHGD